MSNAFGYRFSASFDIRHNKEGKWDTVTLVGDDREKLIELARKSWTNYLADPAAYTITSKTIRFTEYLEPQA